MLADLNWYIIPLAFILDLLVGDPRNLPHPVVWMGKVIEGLEPLVRRQIKNEFVAGIVFAVFLIIITWIISISVLGLATAVTPLFGNLIQIVLLFFCFSTRSLVKAATEVKHALETRGLEAGQKAVSMIVGRETESLDTTGVVRASVETVAENFVDGFLAPLFFAVIGGVPLAVAYKMVNTLDSMVGYKNQRYLLFGRGAARIDDVANYIPARLSVPVIAFAAAILAGKERGLRTFKTALAQGGLHKSPNSGYPEASFAGALGVKLGGPNLYHGTMVEKPFIGQGFKDPDQSMIARACELMVMASFVATSIAFFLVYRWL
ncbi:MAG: adenosylcobinamide-phosphate synthase CbiB [Desulfobacterium sp.]|nr:adenosylcobinamide-phosphate synthase CbiB [Desulfobacterium sp.]